MESMKEKLTEYAQLLVRVGLNIQRGQPLVISSPVECAFFARLCAAEAYQAGCREVVMNWGDDELGRMKYLRAADEVFDTVPLWRRHFFNDHALEGAAYHHFLQLHAFVQYDVFFQCTACGDGDFQFYGRVAHVAHLYCIGSRVKVRESVEAVDVARHASV